MSITDDYSPIYVGDTSVVFAPVFQHLDGTPVNLNNLTISMKMGGTHGGAGPDGVTKTCAGAWAIDDATNGKAHYQWQAADVDTAGEWILYITLTDANGRPVHGDVKDLRILPTI